jgi:hypothetical protein
MVPSTTMTSRGRVWVVCVALAACGDNRADPVAPSDATEPDAARSSAKELTSFDFFLVQNPDLATDATTVIAGTDVTASARFAASRLGLKASFTTTGVNVIVDGVAQVSGVTANNFNNPVTYKVFAEDGSNTEYTVTVAVPGFAPRVDFAAGTGPTSVAIADFNGDTKPDLAVANGSAASVSILLGTTATGATTPTFTTRVNVTTGPSPSGVAVADFNGDGKPDLATANQTGTVSVLLDTTVTGAVVPTFSAKADFATGTGTIAIAVGDLNGDGKPDIAVANNGGDNTASILLNTTATNATVPTFAASFNIPTGPSPFSIALGDLNTDGKPDIMVSHVGGFRPIAVLMNTTATNAATPSFSPKVDIELMSSIGVLTTGDLDGDGRPDLAIADTGFVIILRNTTAMDATTPSFAAGVGAGTGIGPASIAIADLDADGKLDLAVASSTATVAALLNRTETNLSFLAKREFSTAANPACVAVGDLNGDGKPDLAVANNTSASVSVLLAQ